MASLTHLLTRSIEAAHATIKQSNGDGDETVQVPASTIIILAITGLVFFGLAFCVNYTYGGIVVTLCMVEEPETNAYVPVNTIAPEGSTPGSAPPAYSASANDNTPKPNGPAADELEADEVLLVRSQPITSSIRGTLKHLLARAGYLSRYRGLGVYILYVMARGFIVAILSQIPGLRNRLGVSVATVIAEVILCRFLMGWIHIVISEPRPGVKWYSRMPPFYLWKRIAPVAAICSATSEIAHVFPVLVIQSFGSLKHMRDPDFVPGKGDMYAVFGQSLMAIFLILGLFVLLQIPAMVTLVRVAASMLPEEDETIVPFDRTFGGKVTPAIIGGSGRIGMLQAWKSFTWTSRIRLLKLIAKVFLMVLFLWFLMASTLAVEAHVLLGDKLGEVMKAIHGRVGPK